TSQLRDPPQRRARATRSREPRGVPAQAGGALRPGPRPNIRRPLRRPLAPALLGHPPARVAPAGESRACPTVQHAMQQWRWIALAAAGVAVAVAGPRFVFRAASGPVRVVAGTSPYGGPLTRLPMTPAHSVRPMLLADGTPVWVVRGGGDTDV